MAGGVTPQARYRQQQLAAGKCGRGCGRPRWGTRTMCEPCTKAMRRDRQVRYLDACEDRRAAADVRAEA